MTMSVCRSFAFLAAVLMFFTLSSEAAAHSLPLNRVAVNLKDNKLYAVTAIGSETLSLKRMGRNWKLRAR